MEHDDLVLAALADLPEDAFDEMRVEMCLFMAGYKWTLASQPAMSEALRLEALRRLVEGDRLAPVFMAWSEKVALQEQLGG